jgi:integrase
MAIDTASFNSTKHRGLKIHKDSITFLFVIKVNGKRYRKLWKANSAHTKADRMKTAYLALEEFRQQKAQEQLLQVNTEATIEEYWHKLLDIKNWSPHARRDYQSFFNKHLTKMAKLKLRELKPSHFTSLNQNMKHLSLRLQKKAYEILVPIIDLAIEDEIIEKRPIKKSHIPIRKQAEEKKIVIDAVSKYRKIYNAIHTLFANNPHHKAFFLFGFYGRRLGEVHTMHWEDIDFQNNTYRIRKEHSKVRADMIFALPSDIRSALITFQDSTGKVFQIKEVKRYYARIREISGVDEFTFHWMRNLSVSALSTTGVEAIHLSSMLGHQDTATLKKYLTLQRDKSTQQTNSLASDLLH